MTIYLPVSPNRRPTLISSMFMVSAIWRMFLSVINKFVSYVKRTATGLSHVRAKSIKEWPED